jgi:hypothetical protein
LPPTDSCDARERPGQTGGAKRRTTHHRATGRVLGPPRIKAALAAGGSALVALQIVDQQRDADVALEVQQPAVAALPVHPNRRRVADRATEKKKTRQKNILGFEVNNVNHTLKGRRTDVQLVRAFVSGLLFHGIGQNEEATSVHTLTEQDRTGDEAKRRQVESRAEQQGPWRSRLLLLRGRKDALQLCL